MLKKIIKLIRTNQMESLLFEGKSPLNDDCLKIIAVDYGQYDLPRIKSARGTIFEGRFQSLLECITQREVGIGLMPLGKPTVCYIDEKLLSHRTDLPMVNANLSNLTLKLKQLIENKTLKDELGIKGQAYVRKYHDVGMVTEQCLQVYADSYQ